MLRQTVILLIALFAQQAPAEYATPVHLKDVELVSDGSRILSGWEAQPGEHPHQVQLRLVNAAGSVFGCGGSIIHNDWVVSSAHCTAVAVRILVRAGVTRVSLPAEYEQDTFFWFNYPSFDDSRPNVVQPNDIALIWLERPLTYSAYIQPIRVQPSADAFRDYNGLRVIASGFGRTWTNGPQPDVLQWVFLTAVSNLNCRNTFGALITDNAICARFYNVTSQSICQGDSGGPLIIEENGVRTLIGVSSFVAGGNFGCHSGLPGGFIRPGPFLSWFKDITGIDFENIQEDTQTTEPPTTTTTSTTTTTTTTTTTPEPSTTTTSPEPPSTTTTPSPPETTPSPPETTPSPPETTPSPPTTPAPPTPEKPDDDDSDSDEGSSEEDPDLDLLKRLEVKVKVRVRLSKFARQLANQE